MKKSKTIRPSLSSSFKAVSRRILSATAFVMAVALSGVFANAAVPSTAEAKLVPTDSRGNFAPHKTQAKKNNRVHIKCHDERGRRIKFFNKKGKKKRQLKFDSIEPRQDKNGRWFWEAPNGISFPMDRTNIHFKGTQKNFMAMQISGRKQKNDVKTRAPEPKGLLGRYKTYYNENTVSVVTTDLFDGQAWFFRDKRGRLRGVSGKRTTVSEPRASVWAPRK